MERSWQRRAPRRRWSATIKTIRDLASHQRRLPSDAMRIQPPLRPSYMLQQTGATCIRL